MNHDPAAEQVREPVPDLPGAAVRARRRRGRHRQAHARFTDDEWRDVLAAARRAGRTPGGWTAAASVAVARHEPPPRLAVAEAALRELAATRKQLVRVGTLLNQSVKATNASGSVAPGLPYLAGRVEVLIREVDRRTAALLSRRRP